MRKGQILHLESVRERRIEATHTGGGGLQVNERLLVDERHQLRAKSAGFGGLVHDDEASGFLDAVDDRVDVDWPKRAKVDDLRLDALLARLVCGGHGLEQHGSPSQNRHVFARSGDVSALERN